MLNLMLNPPVAALSAKARRAMGGVKHERVMSQMAGG
jgi:hypothetical protein